MAKDLIPCRAMISIDGAEPIPWEDMTPEQLAYVKKKMSENLTRRMSEFVWKHPEYYDLIPGEVVG